MRSRRIALVLGSGVIGLSSAIALADSGLFDEVKVYTLATTPNTTSDVAAAILDPYSIASSSNSHAIAGRALHWTRISLTRYLDIMQSQSRHSTATGIRIASGFELTDDEHRGLGADWWRPLFLWSEPIVNQRSGCGSSESGSGSKKDEILASKVPFTTGYYTKTVLIDMSIYMPWLHKRFLETSDSKTRRSIHVINKSESTNEKTRVYEDIIMKYERDNFSYGHIAVIVNATGTGAFDIDFSSPVSNQTRVSTTDNAVYGLEGRVLLAKPSEEVTQFYIDHRRAANGQNSGDVTYIYPRCNGICVLGGYSRPVTLPLQQKSVSDDKGKKSYPQFNRIASKADISAEATRILDRCSKICPAVADCEIIAEVVGLRPTRVGGVRLDFSLVEYPTATDSKQSLPIGVIHNYGHGGAGVSVSWGCAEEVLAIAKSYLSSRGDLTPLNAKL